MEQEKNSILGWAKQRKNYVSPITSVAWRLKDGAKFGRTFRGNSDGAGDLFNSTWSSLLKLPPISLEIVQNPNPFRSFIEKLRNEEEHVIETFLQKLTYLSVNDSSVNVEDLCFLLNKAENLAVFESTDLVLSDFEKLLGALRTKTRLKAINFQCSLTIAQIHEIFDALKLQLRIVRFCGPPGLEYAEFMKIRANYEFPCVEMLALQNFNFRIIDDDNCEQIDPIKFFNLVYNVFPNLKMLYFDWSVVDDICLFDDRTKGTCQQIQNLFTKLKLQFVAILIYCPSEEMKLSVKKIEEFFQEKNGGSDQLKVRTFEFSIIDDGPTNFSLIVFGEYHYQARTKRLIEVIYDGRETKPDLRHFCYIVDTDRLLSPDATIDFGGLDSTTVAERYNLGLNAGYLEGEAIIDRCFSGSSG